MLMAAMGQLPFHFRHEICAESPSNGWRLAASRLAVATPEFF
jgi:hypothetical protein